MEKIEVVKALKKYIFEETNLSDESLIRTDIDLFEEGILDSLMVISLMAFCQEEFNCDFGSNEFREDSLKSIDLLAEFIVSQN